MAGLGFVRNNPWVQQDRLRKIGPSVLPQSHVNVPNGAYSSDIPASDSGNLICQSEAVSKTKSAVRIRDSQESKPAGPVKSFLEHRGIFEQSSLVGKEKTVPQKLVNSYPDDAVDLEIESPVFNGIDNSVAVDTADIEYGPGIVSRLRHKFLTLAEQARREAEADQAFHQAQKADTRRRRAASVDNLVDSSRNSSSIRSSTRPSRSSSTRDEQNTSIMDSSYAEHSRSVSSLNTLIKFFDTTETPTKPERAPKLPETASVSRKNDDLFKPIEFVASTPEEPKETAQKKSPPTGPSEPLSSLRGKFEVKIQPPAETPSAAKPEKAKEPKPPSPPILKPIAVDTGSNPEPEFLSMRDRLRKVPATKTAAADLKSPPDPSDRGFTFARAETKQVEARPPTQEFSFANNGADHSPPPEEPLPPRNERIVPLEKERSESVASSVLSSDDEVSYDVSEAEQKSSSDANPPVADVNPPIQQMGSGFSEMQRLLDRFDKLKKVQAQNTKMEAEEGTPWYEDSGNPTENAPSEGSKEDRVAEDVPVQVESEPPKRLSLSTQHRLKKQAEEEPSVIDFDSSDDSERKKPASTVELLRNMAHTIGKYFPDEKEVLEVSNVLIHEHKIQNGIEVESEEETQISRSQIVHDTVLDHGGIHYPVETETEEPIQVAGDGNPIRHTLMSLVSDEDMEFLLEDEDDLVFELEGKYGIVKDKGCLLITRRFQAKGPISFTDTPPSAYTYLQEEDAEIWEPGEEINQEQYNTLCQVMRDEYLLKRLEQIEREEALEREGGLDRRELQTDLGKLTSGGLVSYVPQKLSSQEYELGVTNRWSYGDSAGEGVVDNGEETVKTEQKASDSEDLSVRPNSTGDAFSKAETSSADLLF